MKESRFSGFMQQTLRKPTLVLLVLSAASAILNAQANVWTQVTDSLSGVASFSRMRVEWKASARASGVYLLVAKKGSLILKKKIVLSK